MCAAAQSCLTLCNPADCSPPGSPVHGTLQARILRGERVAIPFSRVSSPPGDRTRVSCIVGGFFTHWATWKVWVLLECPSVYLLGGFLSCRYTGWLGEEGEVFCSPSHRGTRFGHDIPGHDNLRESFPRQVDRKSRGPQGERGLQMEEIACKCQTFFFLLSGRRKQTNNIFFLLYTNLKGGFS